MVDADPNAIPEGPADWVAALRPVGTPRRRPLGTPPVSVWHVQLEFRPWEGGRARDLDYGKGKAAVTDDEGNSASAEVEVARRLWRAGWQARVLMLSELPPAHWRAFVAMERDRNALHSRVNALLDAVGRKGAPDVIAWRGTTADPRMIAVECKRLGRDSVKPNQIEWYRRSLADGWLSTEDLVVAEWSMKR